MGLIGLTEKALEGLDRFDGQEVAFYRAATHWINGSETEALKNLNGIESQHASNLRAMILKPNIEVLTQLNWKRFGAQDLLTGIKNDPKFYVRNISFHEDNLPNQPYADIHRYYDHRKPPDFFVSQMIEWHLTPPNIHEVPFPIIGQSLDYDAHIQVLYPWLQVFDEMIVSDHIEWFEVEALSQSVPVSTFPKVFGVPAHLQIDFEKDRPICR